MQKYPDMNRPMRVLGERATTNIRLSHPEGIAINRLQP